MTLKKFSTNLHFPRLALHVNVTLSAWLLTEIVLNTRTLTSSSSSSVSRLAWSVCIPS